jgi:hypothetical protein
MRECKLCGKETVELLGLYWGRCDKVIGAVQAGLVAEPGPRELVI